MQSAFSYAELEKLLGRHGFQIYDWLAPCNIQTRIIDRSWRSFLHGCISYDTICKLQKPRSVATSCQDVLMEYFREHEMVDAAVDGRMTILPPAGQ